MQTAAVCRCVETLAWVLLCSLLLTGALKWKQPLFTSLYVSSMYDMSVCGRVQRTYLGSYLWFGHFRVGLSTLTQRSSDFLMNDPPKNDVPIVTDSFLKYGLHIYICHYSKAKENKNITYFICHIYTLYSSVTLVQWDTITDFLNILNQFLILNIHFHCNFR